MKNQNNNNVRFLSSAISQSNLRHLLAITILIVNFITPSHASAAWVWPWQGGQIQAEAEHQRQEAINSWQRAEAYKNAAMNAVIRERIVKSISVFALLISGGAVAYLLTHRKIVHNIVKQEIIKNEIVENVVHKEVIVRTPAQDVVTDKIVIDGTNLLHGSLYDQKPSLLNLLALIAELQRLKIQFKCFFDANTYYKFQKALRKDHAEAYAQFCRDLPDLFVEVPSGNKADDFILDYAHRSGTPIISNDRYRDFAQYYPWLESESHRRFSFATHSGMLQIVRLGIYAPIPENLIATVSSVCVSLGKPSPKPAPNAAKPTKSAVKNNGHLNGKTVLATA